MSNIETPQTLREQAERITNAAKYADNSSSRKSDLDIAMALRKKADELEDALTKKAEPTITITVKEYDHLQNRMLWLECLEDAGLDNWNGCDYAREDYKILIRDLNE